MTRNEFVDAYLNELLGKLAEAAVTQRSGAELGLWLRNSNAWGRQYLGKAFDEMARKPEQKPGLRVGKEAS